MSDDTVEVKVKLPKPKLGYSNWEPEEPGTLLSDYDGVQTHRMYFVSRRVAPPERMVTLILPEDDVRWWERQPYPPEGPGRRFFEAVRAALAEAQEACGVPPHKPEHECEHHCALPKGHAGSHAP